jgi:branched-chain amino acid transport system permease protein
MTSAIRRNPVALLLVLATLVFALVFPVLMRDRPFWMYVAVQAFFYAMLASSWALLAGYAGQFSFAHMAFMGLAAYTSGIVGREFGATPLQGIILGVILAGFVGTIIGFLCLRLRKTYLALFTIAFAEILRLAINAEVALTGGPNGLYMVGLVGTTFYVCARVLTFRIVLPCNSRG